MNNKHLIKNTKHLKYLRSEPHEFKFKNILLYLIVWIMPKTRDIDSFNEKIFNKLKIGQTGTVLTSISYKGGACTTTLVTFKKVYPYFSSDSGLIIGYARHQDPVTGVVYSEINIFGTVDNGYHFHIPFARTADITIEGKD